MKPDLVTSEFLSRWDSKQLHPALPVAAQDITHHVFHVLAHGAAQELLAIPGKQTNTTIVQLQAEH